MVEETLFETERKLNRTDVAAYVQAIVDKLESGENITLESGTDSISLDIPSEVEFEVKVEREGPQGDDGELSLELELEWPENPSDDSLEIR